MNPEISRILPALVALSMACGCTKGHERLGIQMRFVSTDGKSIELDFINHTLTLPGGRAVSLIECSDSKYTCLDAGRDFALSFPKKCGEDLVSHSARGKFASTVVVALHNDAWVVFDQSPHLMFHYSAPAGVIGIYVPKSSNFDFRSLLQRSDISLEGQDFDEYRIAGDGQLAACN